MIGPDPDYLAAVLEGTPAAPRDTGGASRRSYDAATRAGLKHTRAEWARIVLTCPDSFAAEVVDDARRWSDRWRRRDAGPGWASTT